MSLLFEFQALYALPMAFEDSDFPLSWSIAFVTRLGLAFVEDHDEPSLDPIYLIMTHSQLTCWSKSPDVDWAHKV
jgi:hypothetical protein